MFSPLLGLMVPLAYSGFLKSSGSLIVNGFLHYYGSLALIGFLLKNGSLILLVCYLFMARFSTMGFSE
jgi:hypothetical protein